METLTNKAKKACNETSSRMERAEGNEEFVRYYVETVTESEIIKRNQYTRSVFAGAICKEVAYSCILALEAVLTILRRVHSMNCAGTQTSAYGASYQMNDEDRRCNIQDIDVVISDLLFRVR